MKYNEQYELYRKQLWVSKKGTPLQKKVTDIVRNAIKDFPHWPGTITLTGLFLLGGGIVPWADITIIGDEGEFLSRFLPGDGKGYITIKEDKIRSIEVRFHFVDTDNLFAQAQWSRDYLAQHVLSHVELGEILGRAANGERIGSVFMDVVKTHKIPHLKLLLDRQNI
jgi:hypothetical protein